MIVRTLSFSVSTKTRSDCDDPDFNSDAWIKLSQTSFKDKPIGNFYEWVAAEGHILTIDTIMSLFDQYMSHCNADGSFDTVIYVQKAWPDLPYSMETSNGTLVGPSFEDAVYEEYVNISPTTENVNIPWPTVSTLLLEWKGSVYSACGTRLSVAPKINVDDQGQITWDGAVYGTLRINALVKKEYWDLNVPLVEDLAEESEETNQSTVVASWLGGVDSLEINPPSLTAANCSGGGGIGVDWPDPPPEGTICYERTIWVNACTQELISDTVVEVVCPSEPEVPEEP